MRTLTLISGVLVLLTGVFCFISYQQTFMTVAFIVGIVMVLSGVMHTFVYLCGRGGHNRTDNNGWILVDALVTIVLGVIVLCNQLVVDMTVPIVFGMWVLMSGILRVEAASHIDRVKKRSNFSVVFGTGMLTIVVGVLGMINPFNAYLTTIFMLGIFFVVQAINGIELGINMPHEKKDYVKIYRRNRHPVRITSEEETPEAVAQRLEEKRAAELQNQEIMEKIDASLAESEKEQQMAEIQAAVMAEITTGESVDESKTV